MARLLVNPRGPELANALGNALSSDNVLLSARARRHFTAAIPGPLSIKSVVRGEGRWKTSEGEFLVDTSSLLILNQGQEYSLTIEAREPVETLCLFFRPGFVEDAARAAHSPDRELLDDPALRLGLYFAERAHPANSAVGQSLRGIHSQWRATTDPLWLDARLFEISRQLVELTLDARRRAASIPAVKAATREELVRRVSQARAWLDTHFDAGADVEQAARSACLSPHHFHRVFSRVFGITPHRYVVERRLARALHLLRSTRQPVVDVCVAVGFTSPGTFSTLFRERFGVTPSQARN